MTMNKQTLIDRYLHGQPLNATERSALARQLRGAHNASRAIRLAREEAAAACRDWQPAEPTVGWVAISYVKYKCVWRVMRDGEIVSAHYNETDARNAGAHLAAEVNAEWRGMMPDPRRDGAVKHRETPTDSRETSAGTMRLELDDGQFALVDGEDYQRLAGHLWHCTAYGYAARYGGKDKASDTLMHREILDVPDDMEVDHANGDKLDNRRANLRLATRSQNAMNQKQHTDSASPYKGVYWRKDIKRWHAHIQTDGQKMFLGFFDTAEEGARAYNEAAQKYHGVFAKLNEVT